MITFYDQVDALVICCNSVFAGFFTRGAGDERNAQKKTYKTVSYCCHKSPSREVL
jgi:hypothetical protein